MFLMKQGRKMTWLNDATVKTAEDKAAEAKEQARQAAKANRDQVLNSLTHTFEDGRVIQTRPQDLSIIQVAISLGGDDWVLADNTIAHVTADELTEAMQAGTAQAVAVWNEYKEALRDE